MTKNIEIAKIDRKGLQTRAALNAEAVRDYAETMRENRAALPPVEVYEGPDGTCRLADGFHRVAAALSLGLTEIAANVHEGDYNAALRGALKANVTHGMRRTNADKRQAMKIAWEHRLELFGGDPSSRELAEICCVSHGTANDFIQINSLSKLDTLAKTDVVATARQEAKVVTSSKTITTKAALDRFGMEIPENLRGAFASPGVKPEIVMIRKVRKLLKAGCESGSSAFAALDWQRVDIKLEDVARELKFARPHCVCRMCRGTGCNACHNRGFQTKLEYEANPSEYRAEGSVIDLYNDIDNITDR